jgi:two-component system CheB/CheR fusion protein
VSNTQKSRANTDQKTDTTQECATFPIVGIGASAGGLEAFTKLLAHLPINTGMSFVLLQHLDPKHESLSPDILSRVTKMPVIEVKDGMPAERNHVYVIPSGFSMGILHGVLSLIPRVEDRGPHFVIDFFFKALANDQKNRAIGIVLSGTGSDGTQGLMAIKAEGGITFAQTPKSAKFDSMPLSAIASGNVDLTLSPEQIADELVRIAHHPYVVPSVFAVPDNELDNPPLKSQDSLSHIFLLLRNQCHVDFSLYKSNTVNRRIERRMALHKIDDLKAYATLLAKNPDEVKALYADILINVTSFFRDPEAFEALKTEVFPKLMENHPPGAPIRIWVPGCSTGEEAYSIAISLLEFLGEKVSRTPIQIFASDISEQAIQKARTGEYASIANDVSDERLSRFFIRLENGEYKIAKSIRDICLFSRHDITTDPPFNKIDLISCRNLLIYFTPKLQKHVIPIFHYSLLPGRFLWLGKSETIGGSSDLFSMFDKANKLYVRTNAPITLNLRFPTRSYVAGKQQSTPEPKTFKNMAVDLQKITEETLQAASPTVLVNEEMEILQFRGRTTPFIEAASGVPSLNLFKMAHPDLLRDIRMTVQAAKTSGKMEKKEELSLGKGRALQTFNLIVMPAQPKPQSKERLYLVIFEKTATPKLKKNKQLPRSNRRVSVLDVRKDPYVLELQQELSASQEYQHSLIEKFDGAQEDLTTANEELQSTNEELQSTNEELETAKEELQSGNEELTTVNDELQARSVEQIETNNDLINLLGSVQIPIVMLGDDRRVRRFTPLAGKALNLIPSDVGRPLSDLKLNFTQPGGDLDLEQMVSDTIRTLSSQEVEVQDRKGCWFRLEVRPYKTVDNKIDGAVLALVDIDNLKLSLKEVREARGEAEKANRAKDLFLATLSHELRTPLTAILSWAEMLSSGKLDAAKAKRGAEIIAICGKTQAQLINDLLDVSRIVAGKLALETLEVDLDPIVHAAVDSIRPTAEAKSIQVETHFAPKVGTVVADPVRLQQVFWNLLTNAVKFSAPQSKITIKVERVSGTDGEKAKAMIQITDSGKGIEADFLPHIFDRFSQQDSSSVRIHGGLGLGLAIVRNLVELHGGTIKAENALDGSGATFTILLPIKSDKPLGSKMGHIESLKSSITVGSVPVRLDGLRVLIVDDEESAREALGEILSSFGAEIKTAESTQEGLLVFEKFRPNVLVSDIAMPGEDGYSFIKKIRALTPAKGRNTPAIALTAFAATDDIERALLSGFEAHLAKPVDGQQLAKAIARLAIK